MSKITDIKNFHFRRTLSLLLILLWGLSQNNHAIEITKTETFSFSTLPLSKVKVSNQYGQVKINTSHSDSIYVDVSLSVKLDTKEDSVDFFKGVRYNAYSTRNLTEISLLVDPQYASNFIFESTITINAPDSLIWDITNRFGDVNLCNSLSVQSLNHDYGKVWAPTIKAPNNRLSNMSFFQSEVIIDTVVNAIIHSENSILEFVHIENGIVKSEFSTWMINNTNELNITTETDNIEIKHAIFLHIHGMYSDCTVDSIEDKLETELIYGKFILKHIEPNFNTININHSNVFTNLNIIDTIPFYLNADVKYCDLVLAPNVKNNVKTIHDGALKIMNGLIGQNETEASVNIVARFENIYLNRK